MSTDTLSQRIIEWFTGQSGDVERCKVKGVDDQGVERIVDLVSMSGYFGEYDYKTILDEPGIFQSDVLTSPMGGRLISVADSKPAYFAGDIQ